MNRLIDTSCKLLICVLITMCVGCRTKKSIAIESIKQTYNSEQVTTERNEKHVSLIDTTNIDELTSVIREFVLKFLAWRIVLLPTQMSEQSANG